MFCMCWDDQDVMDKNGESEFQCGTIGVASMAAEAKVKKLVLIHMGPNLQNANSARKIISDIKSIYDGDIIFSDELIQIPI